MPRPTLVDVAAASGVSKSTVSLVVAGSPLVGAATRARVLEAVRALGYVRNRAAATLRGSATGLVGLVINDIRNPFFTEFAAAAQMALAERRYVTVIANTDESAATQEQVVSAMLEHHVAGLILSPAYGDTATTFAAIGRAGIPALQVLRAVDPRPEPLPFFSLDYATGGRLAAEHLRTGGARRIAFAGGIESRPVTTERRDGYDRLMAAMGTPPLVFPGRPTRGFGHAVAARLRSEYSAIDGVVCFNDLTALGLLSGLAAAGVAVGRDVLVCGFDDIEDCAFAAPPLSSVRCDIAGFGRAAAARLRGWIEDGVRPPAVERAPVALVPRASGGA